MPLISVIVPIYNQAQYLDECLQSVLDQTFPDWECIIVDDGSTDNTQEAVTKWLEKDVRFKYFRKDNGGVASARNFGIAKTEAEWILPLDGDDKLGSRYLELAKKKFNLGYNVISSNVRHFGIKTTLRDSEPFELNELLFSAPFCISTFFLKSNWSAVGGFDSNLTHGLEDTEFWIHLLSKTTMNHVNLDYTGLYYRTHEKSRSTDLLTDRNTIISSWAYVIRKHAHLYALNINRTSEVYYKNKKYQKAINLLKKSRALMFLNKVGILTWIKKL